jgi:hypothetical protein
MQFSNYPLNKYIYAALGNASDAYRLLGEVRVTNYNCESIYNSYGENGVPICSSELKCNSLLENDITQVNNEAVVYKPFDSNCVAVLGNNQNGVFAWQNPLTNFLKSNELTVGVIETPYALELSKSNGYLPFTSVVNVPNYSVVNLVDSAVFKRDYPERIFSVDRLIENDITLGYKILSSSFKTDNTDFIKSIDKIDRNKIYNSNTLFSDLNNLFDDILSPKVVNKIRKFFGVKDELNIDSMFDELVKISSQDLIYLEDIYTFCEVNYIIDNREKIEYHLKLKALNRYIKSEIQKIHVHEQLRISLGCPLVLHLREYLDNIGNIKKDQHTANLQLLVDSHLFNINSHEIKRKN